MNIYQFKTACAICGGEGMGTIDSIYSGAVHKNPDICRKILKQKAVKIKKREKALDRIKCYQDLIM